MYILPVYKDFFLFYLGNVNSFHFIQNNRAKTKWRMRESTRTNM